MHSYILSQVHILVEFTYLKSMSAAESEVRRERGREATRWETRKVGPE